MNVHDIAHELARAIKQSSEYKELMLAREGIKDNASAVEMIKDFRLKQFEVQAAQLSGETVPEEKMKQLASLYEILALNPAVRQYLAAEYSFSRLLSDVQKIIGEAVKDCLE